MPFTLAPYVSYQDIPVAYVIELGGEEFLGLLDPDGGFQQINSLREIPDTDWWPVEMFGPSLGLLKPCYAKIVVNEKEIGSISISVIDGRPACVSIMSVAHGLTGTLLRQIPIARLVREAAITNTVRVLSTEEGVFGARYVEGGPGFGHLYGDLRAELTAVDEAGRRRVINESFLKMVAHVYRTGMRLGMNPSKHVENMLGPTSPSNARRWVSAARREGFLGPSPGKGKSGEVLGT